MFAGLLENAVEMADQDPSVVAPIGECFEDMTEVMNKLYNHLVGIKGLVNLNVSQNKSVKFLGTSL